MRSLHAGPQLTCSVLVRRYWITRSNTLNRDVIHHCVRCTRFRMDTAHQQMAGPLQLRTTKDRRHKSYKGYICLLVCMASRAVHLEAVSDLSSKSFLTAFRRVVARRGHCARLMSDNATNLREADRELRAMFSSAAVFYQQCREHLASDDTEWVFIPPSAPHFGGI